MSLQRLFAVAEGRAMVRVRRLGTQELATAGFCPACWNAPERRRDLLRQLAKLGYEVVHRDDREEGVYRPGKAHAAGCRHAAPAGDPWRRFSAAVRRTRG